MAHKMVSNKATLKNEGFLSSLSSTLMGRLPPDQIDTRSTLKWHKTSDVKKRIKTATGTIAVYTDTTAEEEEIIMDSVAGILGLGEEEVPMETETVVTVIATSTTEIVQISIAENGDDILPGSLYIAIDDYSPLDNEEIALTSGQKVTIVDATNPHKKPRLETPDGVQLLDNSAAKYKISIRPVKHHPNRRSREPETEPEQERWLVRDSDTGNEGLVPSNLLGRAPVGAILTSIKRSMEDMSAEECLEIKKKVMQEMKEIKTHKRSKVLGPSPEQEAHVKRKSTINELLETEDEFVKDLQYVMENYCSHVDDAGVPKIVKDNKVALFSNFNAITEFHQNVLIEGLKFNAEVPKMIGKTFLRLERDFDKHAEYCSQEPLAQELLENNSEIKDYFEKHSQKIGDEKSLQEHLKLPIQRLNDYQLLLKELVKYSSRLDDDTTELERAQELMQTIPQRATDSKFIASIEGYKGNLFKLGRLIRHDWFSVSEVDKKPKDRYLFLFKARILITKVKRISDDRSVFILKDIIRLPETSLSTSDNSKVLEFHHIEPQNHPNFPLVLDARTAEIREAWLSVVQEHVVDTASVEDLLFDDEIRVVSEEIEEDNLGYTSPPADYEEFDELPDDLVDALPEDNYQVVPDIITQKEPQPVCEVPEIPIDEAKEEVSKKRPQEEDLDFWGGKEASPPPKRRVPDKPEETQQEPEPALVHQKGEEPVVVEQKVVEPEPKEKSPEPKEKSPEPVSPKSKTTPKRPKEEEEFDFWSESESSPPLKKRAPISSDPQEYISETSVNVIVEPIISEAPDSKDYLEQVEEPLVNKEGEKVAEPKQDYSQDIYSDDKQESPADGIAKSTEKQALTSESSKDDEQKEKIIEEKSESITSAKRKEEKQKKLVGKKSKTDKKEEIVEEKPIEKPPKSSSPPKEVVPVVDTKPTPEEKQVPVPTEPILTDQPQKAKKTSKVVKETKSEPESPTVNMSSQPSTPGTGGPKPVFTKTISGDVVEPGDGVKFVCEISHPTNYYVTWLKDNKPLEDKLADRVQQKEEGNKHSLRLMNCRIEDEGTYAAKATDPKGGFSTCSAQLLVHEFTPEERAKRLAERSPFFLVKMINAEVIENTNLSYVIHVKGDPMPSVTFMKDNADLKTDDRVKIHGDPDHGKYELLITHVQKADAGVYKCIAENKFDIVECQAVMTVTEEEQVLQKLSGKGSLVQPGEKAEFTWFRDGVEFDPLDRFNVMFKDEEDTLALVFQNVTPDDAGIYTCVASTSCGKISCSAELTVEGAINRLMKDPVPPTFQEALEDSSAILGGTAMLECKVSGYPKPDLAWYKNGDDLKLGGRVKMLWEDDTSATLIIKNITEDDKGVYKVLAKNELGEVESSCKLTIKSAPKFKKMDKFVGCNIGQTLNYVIEVDGEPLPEIKWMKDGKEIQASDRFQFDKKADGTFSFKIHSMTAEDCGAYTIVATNDMGQRTENFEVQSETAPEITRGLETETEKKFKNEQVFEVRAKGSPAPTATWYKDGKEITDDGEHFKITTDDLYYMLTIKDISRADTGLYKIVLTNTKGKAESEGSLSVRGPPDFTSPLEDACAKEGAKEVRMSVSFVSYPRPSLKWTFNNKAIHDDTPGYRIENTDCGSVLILLDATPDVVGNYSVQASNEYGDTSASARFRLHEIPQVVDALKDVEFLEDQPSKYVCKVTGVPVPDISWTKDGKPWTPDGERVKCKKDGEEIYMIITDEAKTEDSGHYVAKISNVEGSITTEGTIIVNTPPHILGSNFKEGLTFIAMHKFILEVEVIAVPEAEATWFCQGKELKEEEGRIKISYDGKFYRLERLVSDPEESGEYKCKLKNKIKEVEEVGQINIIEKESRVRMALKDVDIKEFTDCVLQCQIVGDPIPDVEWLRDGEPITDFERFEIREDRETRMHYLTFSTVTEKDKSTFTVRGTNEHGDCETECLMTVHVVPQPGEFQDVVVDWGRDLLLSLTIHAIPHPEVVWFQDGKKIDENDRITYLRDDTTETYSLVVKTVVLEDGGTYSFTATNCVGEASRESIVKIHTEVPRILNPLKDVEICLEDEIKFEIRSGGLPLPEIEWRNKGKVVNNADKYTMDRPLPDVYNITLKYLELEDYGEIFASAKNLVGEATTTCNLIQKMLECEVLEGLPNVIKGSEGDNVSLTIKIRASPRPTVVWTKDGDVLEASGKFVMTMEKTSFCEATLNLTLTQAYSDANGQYRVKFSNEVNEAYSETAIIIAPERQPPVITSKPDDITVSEMDPTIIKCSVNGFPKPEIKWLKDGREVMQTDLMNIGVTADGVHYLEFKHVTKDDAGRYRLIATNDEGVAECEANLNVNPTSSRPEFLQKMQPTKVITGYPCRMEVKLDGFPKPQISWLKNGKPVEIDGSHVQEVITDDGAVILQIENATDDDAGSYTVIASNELGQQESSADLAVLDHERVDGQPDGPAEFTDGLTDCCFDEGKHMRLPVCVKGGAVPNMKWYKDGKEIGLDDRTFFTYDGDRTYLEIHPCKGSDSGKYKCVIENENGTDETECEVTVRKCFEKPTFIQTFPGQEQVQGGDVKFGIKVDGVPKPELSWFFNDKPIIPDGKKFRIRKEPDGCALFVRGADYDDTGSYKVIAKNREGEIQHKANLRVGDDVDPSRKYEPPVFLKVIGDQELYQDYTARFKAIVRGRPTPDFDWYRNGVKLFPSKRMIIERDLDGVLRLNIRHVCEEDMGVYELKVWNDYGEANCKGKLICECISKDMKRPIGDEYEGFERIRQTGAPVPLPEIPIICALSDRRVTLSWIPYLPAGPMPPCTYQVEMCELPEGDWVTACSGIRGNSVDITTLNPKSDYRFRIRVENRYGVSEPSPYVATHRNRLECHPVSHEPTLEGVYDGPKDGPYVPIGFTLDRDSRGNFSAAPRFLRLKHDTQYGMKNFNTRVKWVVYGYPTPKLKFYFKDKEITFGKGSKYTFTHEPSGDVCLYLDKIKENDVGWYKCVAFNEYGESQQRVRLALSEYPRVIQHLQETYIKSHTSGKIVCRISAFPPCDVKWFKDWQEIQPSIKFKAQFIEPDTYCLNFQSPTIKDAGLYSIAAVNVAGSVSSSGMVHIEDGEFNFNWAGPGRGKHVDINSKKGSLQDHYDIGDELGRGTQGITYHTVEHHTGRNLAAKTMYGDDNLKVWMKMEYEMMNLCNSSKHITRLFDAYEGRKNLDLVMELNAGGEVIDGLTRRDYITEHEVAIYMKQVLEGLEFMHDRCIAHLGLNVGDIMFTRPNGLDVRFSDLSLARHIRLNKLQPLDYGMPEFVAPEIANGQKVSYPADMWAVGVISYLLLSGTSPFRGEHDKETLTRVQKGELCFDMEAFAHISSEAKDFIAKLLQFKAENRMDVKNALRHPWINFADMSPRDPHKINTDRLRTYYAKYRDWYRNASCRRWFRRRPLAGAFTHPSKMVYPPYEVYTPERTPDREIKDAYPEDYDIPHKDYSYELGLIKNESNYQCGPDTYLLQLRDSDFPARLRQYMKVAKYRSPSFAQTLRSNNYDYERIPIVHERRRFTDIMDEEIDDERKKTIVDKYTSGFYRSKNETCSLDLPKRLKQEVSTRYSCREEVEAEKQKKVDGKAPFIREKPETTAITEGMELTLSCVVTGDPEPVVQWSRNDIIIGETARISQTSSGGGRSQLKYQECKEVDLGIYKIVARNCVGQVEHKFRLVKAEIPGLCEPPEHMKSSGYHMLLKWRPPVDDGGAPVQCYHLEVKGKGQNEWENVSNNIEQELYLVEDLCPNQPYQFRVASKNFKGWSNFSMTTGIMKTIQRDEPPIPMPIDQELQLKAPKVQVLQLPGARGEMRDVLDYNREVQQVPLKTGDAAELQIRKYKMVAELSRGQFSTVMRTLRQDDQRTFACKIFDRKNREDAVKHEYETMKSLRHERLTILYEAYHLPDVTIFMMDYLGGSNVLTYLASKLEYTEQTVSIIINQVLDGISYLHWRGLCHLDIQPDNIVMTSPKKLTIKIVDFGSAQKVEPSGSQVCTTGLLDYMAPEVLDTQTAYPNSDVWSIGVLTYVLLAGTTPFRGINEEDTKTNIKFVRFKFEDLGRKASQEAARFIMLVFKLDHSKRPSVEYCREHQWLTQNEFLLKKRERAVISSGRLREYCSAYQRSKTLEANTSEIFKPYTSQC